MQHSEAVNYLCSIITGEHTREKNPTVAPNAKNPLLLRPNYEVISFVTQMRKFTCVKCVEKDLVMPKILSIT